MKKLLTILLLLFQLTIYAQDDFSLTYNPFNEEHQVNPEAMYMADDYYMDVPVVFYVYDNSRDNYILLEGLVIYQNYYDYECPEETVWDILEFANNNYKPFNPITYEILGFKIITQWQLQPSQMH